MKARGPMVGALAIAAGATAAGAAWTWYATRDEIPVVRTYADLLAQDPIVLADGTKVWLGKEAASCAVGSGVLVYVLEEALDVRVLSRNGLVQDADQVGPIRIRTHHVVERRQDAVTREITGEFPAGRLTWLLTRRIDLTEPGSVQFEALTLDGARLKWSRVRGESVDYHPWMHWGRWHQDLGSDGLVMGTALPCGPDFVSVSSDSRSLLPSTALEDQSGALTIKRTANGISVESGQKMFFHQGSHLYLARFWVNGTAFVPRQSGSWREQGNGILHIKSFESDLDLPWSAELNLDLPWSAIGAHPGDRIGLQVLFCPHGSSPPSDITAQLKRRSGGNDLGSPRLSNSIEFIAQ